MKRYKFLREIDNKIKSENGNCGWKIGEWKEYGGNLDMCHSGFHCSKKVYQAFSYVQGEILAEVEVGGDKIIGDDKEVYSKMKIVKAWKWRKEDSVSLAIYSAKLCLKNFEKVYPDDKRPRQAIEAAINYLKEPTEENMSAARSAWSAAESAAESAARSAAWSAAESAGSAARSAAESAARSAWSAARSAESAARSAAESAARSAAWSAAIKKISTWMDKRVKELQSYNS